MLCAACVQDVSFVLCYTKIWDHYLGRKDVPKFRSWFQWSDNCAAQFKCADGFWMHSLYDELLRRDGSEGPKVTCA